MIRHFARFMGGRGMTKLRRNRMAMIALSIISLYVLMALLILVFGLIAKESTTEKIGPATTPGMFSTPLPEKRLENAAFYLEELEGALDSRDPAQAVGDLHFAELVVKDLPHEELRATVEQGWKLYDELGESDDLNSAPELMGGMAELEAVAASLYVQPTGLDGQLYAMRLSLGTDRQGRSIMVRALYSIKVAT